MGFDVLYLPPVHPIGQTARKGPNAATVAEPDDVGSPWAIGAAAGGHTAIHPALGTLDDFRELVAEAARRGIDVAIDLAFQASPDHPWVREHPTWFRHAPDGTIRYAENPPKRYEDIYPFDFETADWPELWHALLDVVRFWIDQGVRVFRVDNPHTKPFVFWEWLLASVQAEAPGTIFLSEAFTRPRVMEHLARVGFTQSYTYFTWRTSKWELESYLQELTQSETAQFLRPNLWPNTPDILSEELQDGGRSAFLSRLVLAATLTASYGIYGPAFELQEHLPRESGSEEYLRSEKYEIRSWDRDSPSSLSPFIALVNRIRQEHVALQFNDSLRFHRTDNDALIAYSKVRDTGTGRDAVLTVVNLDHAHAQSGWLHLDLDELGLRQEAPFVAHDLLSDARYAWRGGVNFVKLDPADVPCHIFSLTQRDSPGDPAR
jgi:starch synthase (maltosyl-transferring)